MPQREYASKKYALKGLCLKGTPFDSYAKRGDASKKYALKGKCLKKLCPKGTMPPKTMPFYCTTLKCPHLFTLGGGSLKWSKSCPHCY